MENYFLLLACALPIFIFARSKAFFRTFFFTAFTGIGALSVVCWLGAYTGVLLTFNPFTAGVSCLLGIPGVLALLLFRILFAL